MNKIGFIAENHTVARCGRTQYRFQSNSSIDEDSILLGKDLEGHIIAHSMDMYKTQLNNNVLIEGASGAGKTRYYVEPNIRQAVGSYIITDPKGNLYNKNKEYLEAKGYDVKKLDFINPIDSEGYNFFEYIHNDMDIIKVAHMIVYMHSGHGRHIDPFWDEACQLLLEALIAYIIEVFEPKDRTLETINRLLGMAYVDENDINSKSALDILFKELEEVNADSFAARTYDKYRIAAGKTLKSILISLNSILAQLDCKAVNYLNFASFVTRI